MSYRAASCSAVLDFLNNSLLIQALQGIQPGTISHREFQKLAGMTDRTLVLRLLDLLAENGIGTAQLSLQKTRRTIVFSESDRLSASLLAIQNGCDIERVSAILNWKDFEALAARVLELTGYVTSKNVRFRRPRVEIDVVGRMNGLAVAVDCKHWNRRNSSAVRAAASKQAARCSRLLENSGANARSISRVLPVVLTLYPLPFRFSDGIPVVPVTQFAAFVRDLDSFAGELRFIV